MTTVPGHHHEPVSTRLLSFKVGFLAYYGSNGILTFFLPLYLKMLGLNPMQIGIVTCTRALGGLLGSILLSMWIKTLAKKKHLLLVLVGLNGSFVLTLAAATPSSPEECAQNVSNLPVGDYSWMFTNKSLVAVFLAVTIFVFLTDVFNLAISTALHGGCMIQLGEANTKSFGPVRAWGAMGEILAFLAVGVVVTGTVRPTRVCGRLVIQADYHPMFYIFTWFAFIGVLNASYVSMKPPDGHVVDGGSTSLPSAFQALSTFKTVSWMTVQLCRSMFFAVTHGFLNWHVQNIGASPLLIGCHNSSSTLAQFIAFLASPFLIQTFGESRLVFADFLSQILRLVAISFISNPAYITLIAAFEGLMFASTWSATASYLSNQVPEERQTEVQGVLQMIHTSGKAAGFLISGCLTQAYGAPVMFLIFAGVACLALLLFAIAHMK